MASRRLVPDPEKTMKAIRNTVAMTLIVASSTAFAGANAAGDNAPTASRTTNGEYHYTWEQLVELIPDIRSMQVVVPKQSRVANGGRPATLLCNLESEPGTLIARRKCYTLDDYVRKRLLERQQVQDFLAGRDTRVLLD
jgi:hypothetical protein